ncbi:hypothetical protein NDU88_001857 [Pleurodeles waltl]|uniref:Uncharacterized protein n=1 Tax=Pleurodeles waltl TaxID=8319 RepID=A0AAV7ML00_PLEWA|nr:hypothetical protein NDU88_001857 [Pleurodeles waltl]
MEITISRSNVSQLQGTPSQPLRSHLTSQMTCRISNERLGPSRDSPVRACLRRQPPPAPAPMQYLLLTQVRAGPAQDQHSSTSAPLQAPVSHRRHSSNPLGSGHLFLLTSAHLPRPSQPRSGSPALAHSHQASQKLQRHLAPRGAPSAASPIFSVLPARHQRAPVLSRSLPGLPGRLTLLVEAARHRLPGPKA